MLLLHGGVGEEPTPSFVAGLHRAAEAGASALHQGVPLDAVVESLAVLEEDCHFNAGHGSAFNEHGDCEGDAALVDGGAGRWAGVASLRDTAHPIRVARHLLQDGGPVLLAGGGAEHFARQHGFASANLRTDARRCQWRQKCRGEATPLIGESAGCIAADATPGGGIAAGSSGGGPTSKPAGRVGEAAVVGAGLYADQDIAVLCAGAGEAALIPVLALRAALRCRERDAAAAAEWALGTVSAHEAPLGVVVYDRPSRTVVVLHNAEHFPVLLDSGRGGTLIDVPSGGVHRCQVP